jgi:chemotaxis protein methyltransferase CheR
LEIPVPASALAPKTDHLAPRDFKRLSELIHATSGLKMPPTKQTMLEGRLRRRLAALGVGSLHDYVETLFRLTAEDFDQEVIHLIDLATTNKTDFFREPSHFAFLAATALPEMLQEGRRRVALWSAAASTGAEAYTLAMVMEEFRREHGGPAYSILGTDICTEVLQEAAAARYPAAMIEPVPLALRRRYLLASREPHAKEVRIAPGLRANVAFARLNLMDERYPVPRDMDVIFCRNILIYFDKPTQQKVLQRLCRHLRPGGYLMLGHSESVVGVELPLKTLVNTVFQRI